MKQNVGLKVTGIIIAIIVVSGLLAYFVGAPIFRGMKYNNAQKLAENGQYVEALAELQGNMGDYKDTQAKKQEYAFKAAKQFYEEKDVDSAYRYLEIALNYNADKEITQEALELLKKIDSE